MSAITANKSLQRTAGLRFSHFVAQRPAAAEFRRYTMKPSLVFTIGIVAMLALVGCRTALSEEQVDHHYAIVVSGAAGASFTGTIKVDGVRQTVSGTAPTTLSFYCRRLDCSFHQGAESGWLRFEVRDSARILGAGATTGPEGHCRFTARDGQLGSKTSWRLEP